MKPETESKTEPLAVIGVDIGKEVFHLVGLGVDVSVVRVFETTGWLN